MSANDAIEIFSAGVEAVKPGMLLPQYLQLEGDMLTIGKQHFSLNELDSVYLLCVGKAASAMALEAEKILNERIAVGLVITKNNHALALRLCTTIEAGHPVPDEKSIIAAKEVQQFLQQLTPQSLLLCCISGGASALLADKAPGISLEDMQQLSTLLLQCGADIQEINAVRKHLSKLKGGKLVQQCNGAKVVSFIISDVLGDDISVIASGLTAPDSSTFMDAFKVLKKYDLLDDCPLSITRHIIDGIRGHIPETPMPGNAIFSRVHNNIIGTNSIALQATALKAKQLGYEVHIINENLQGEAEEQALIFVRQLLQYTGDKAACFLIGGETTVTIKGNGKGGRNQHFVLACLCELLNQHIAPGNIPIILSGGTDGTDGPTDAAGAFIDAGIINNIQEQGLQPLPYLQNNDAYPLFKQLNALLITGPTQTNVMDIVVGLLPRKD